ncbi:hypothetical protein IJD15_00510 [bacterium]|nr:hypothetical protein [bacterium]
MTSIMTYEQVKNFYEDFKNNLPKDDFTRYYKEVSFMRTLIEFAKKQGLKEDVFEYKKIEETATKKLRDLGYNI